MRKTRFSALVLFPIGVTGSNEDLIRLSCQSQKHVNVTGHYTCHSAYFTFVALSSEWFVMDLLFDAASTSDVGERELLESASSEYWDRVLLTPNGQPNQRPPDASSDFDMTDSMVRVIHPNRSMTSGCVRLRCIIGPPPSQEASFCIHHRPLRLHMMSLSAPLKIPQHQVGRVVGLQRHRLSHRPSLLLLLSPRRVIVLVH